MNMCVQACLIVGLLLNFAWNPLVAMKPFEELIEALCLIEASYKQGDADDSVTQENIKFFQKNEQALFNRARKIKVEEFDSYQNFLKYALEKKAFDVVCSLSKCWIFVIRDKYVEYNDFDNDERKSIAADEEFEIFVRNHFAINESSQELWNMRGKLFQQGILGCRRKFDGYESYVKHLTPDFLNNLISHCGVDILKQWRPWYTWGKWGRTYKSRDLFQAYVDFIANYECKKYLYGRVTVDPNFYEVLEFLYRHSENQEIIINDYEYPHADQRYRKITSITSHSQALHLAVNACAPETVTYLLDLGIDGNAVNRNGLTACEAAFKIYDYYDVPKKKRKKAKEIMNITEVMSKIRDDNECKKQRAQSKMSAYDCC